MKSLRFPQPSKSYAARFLHELPTEVCDLGVSTLRASNSACLAKELKGPVNATSGTVAAALHGLRAFGLGEVHSIDDALSQFPAVQNFSCAEFRKHIIEEIFELRY